jgi:DNA processing protein
LYQRPLSFSYLGNLALLKEPGIAIIGARSCTRYGRNQARSLAHAVATAGGVVISGMAAGIDSEAHLGANGRTIAVLGQGIDVSMAWWQERIKQEILKKGGLILSEFAPDHPASIWTFPQRNRIVAALASTIVVVEAAAKSGTQITVDFGLELGKEILAVPGPVGAPASIGCLKLIAEGAGVVQGPRSVLEAARLI